MAKRRQYTSSWRSFNRRQFLALFFASTTEKVKEDIPGRLPSTGSLKVAPAAAAAVEVEVGGLNPHSSDGGCG
jgi:hypothetical protein